MSERIFDHVKYGFGCYYDVDKVLYEKESEFQHIKIVENKFFGRILVIDDNVQTTEKDDFMYHELLCHVPMLTHPHPQKVLIIGGGDGGLLKEVLKYPVQEATLVEIDKEVIAAVSEHIPSIPENAFSDSRSKILIQDGVNFVNNLKTTKETYDVVLIDSTDPEGPSLGLFTEDFYGKIAQSLTKDGVLTVQSGSPIYQKEMLDLVRKNMKPHFKFLRTYLGTVLSYPGVVWSFTIGSQTCDSARLYEEQLQTRLGSIKTKYYSPKMHHSIFVIPPYIDL